MTTDRPTLNTNGLPAALIPRILEKAARSWCYVTPDGRAFYVSQKQAENMQAREGGTVFAPAA